MSVPDAVEDLVRDAPLSAFLATSANDRPHVAPVWYDYRDGVVSVLTGGRKLHNVRANPHVSLAIEDSHGPDVRWRVVMLGTARVVDDSEARAEVSQRISETYRERSTETDGGDPGGLVQIRVGSASVERY